MDLADPTERTVRQNRGEPSGDADDDDETRRATDRPSATAAAIAFVERAWEVSEGTRLATGVTGPGHGAVMVCEPEVDMAETTTRPPLDAPASAYDRGWLAQHLAEERRASSLLGEIREVVFGLQDGLVSTLASWRRWPARLREAFPVIVAGIASALAGVFSMAAGEYIGSKSQREIFDAQIHDERHEVEERPGEAEAEVAFMLAEEGLGEEDAARDRGNDGPPPRGPARTMVARELGIQVDDRGGSVLRGALFMGAAFGLGAFVPILPFLILPFSMSLPVAAAATGVVLFGIGVVKSRWTHRSAISSGLEVLRLAAFAGIAGYLFGTVLPAAGRRGDHEVRRLAESLGEADLDRVALALIDHLAEVGLDRQLVGTVAHRHERASERMAVDRPGDLHETTGPEVRRAPVGHDVGPAALGWALHQRPGEGLVQRTSGGHVISSTM